MIPSSRNAVVTYPILFWAALIVGVLPKTAWAQEITARTPSRTAVRQERRDALRDSRSTLKKAIKAGEIWTGLWGLPEDCPYGFSGMPTSGLVTKASYYSSGDPEPGIIRQSQSPDPRKLPHRLLCRRHHRRHADHHVHSRSAGKDRG